MTVFGKYASFYDSFYQDKAYEAECDFLELMFKRYTFKPPKTILDLGCGTGGHSVILARRGYQVIGIDRSVEMLGLARQKEGAQNVAFCHGDIRNLKLEQTFDVVISMFAVMSYMTTNEDLMAAFHTARLHLNAGCIFVFDSWFGPGVFHDPPSYKCKEVMNQGMRVKRIATPQLDPVSQVVDVQFDILEIDGNHCVNEVTEHHLMRPLFVQEIKQIASLNDLELLAVFPWTNVDHEIGLTDWLSCFVLRAH